SSEAGLWVTVEGASSAILLKSKITLKCGFDLGFTLKPTLLILEINSVNGLLSSGTLFSLFSPLLHLLLGRYAFHLWRPLSQVITEATKKLPTAVSVRNKQTIFNIHPEKKKKQGTKAKRYIFVAYLPINESNDLW
uniref:Uncharacterized protein n=1 Tax=Sinocyclocheilus grahami TaxID=75366 RepID=A0A672L9S2_SINGR